MEWIKRNPLQWTLAGLVFGISFVVYLLTISPTVPFWDCGEFIATSYTLGVPHPPGSPLFILVGRLFSMIPTSPDIAFRVNLISPIVSALANMFLFLIIVKLANKLNLGEGAYQKLAVYGGAFIGALAFAFTDSHWFNAVEAEVYSSSIFLTAIVVWLILVWEERAHQPESDRYLLLIAYIVGLAIGVHLLNLLAIFFIALIIYFKKYQVSSVWWLILDLIIGIAIVGLLFVFFRQLRISFSLQALLTLGIFMLLYYQILKQARSPRLKEHGRNVLMAFMASLGFLFINGGIIQGLPSLANKWGVAAVVVAIALILGVTIWAIAQKRHLLSLIMMSLVLIIIGYSTYATIFIRSIQDPRIDENDPETTKQAVAYLQREQYGQREFTDVFNRAKWKPEAAHKYKGAWDYFWNYQINYMYIRYFGWQFIGRNVDKVDYFQFLLPLPFLIGLYGLLVHFSRDRHKALAVLALFLFTGLMIVLYLNQDDPQPRERDYSYVGSFFAFAIWIGIGLAAIISEVARLRKQKWQKYLVWTTTAALFLLLPVNMLIANYHEHDRSGNYVAWDYSYNLLNSCEPNGILFTNGDNDTFPLWYLQEVENVRRDVKVVNLSLLNTPWYIKQLRNIEPRLEIGPFSDAEIDRFELVRFEKQKVQISPPDNNLPPLTWELAPTLKYGNIGLLRVQDYMIINILEFNKWQRPVYFATTVSPDNKLGLEDYMIMEGLVFRVMPTKAKRVDAKKIEHNLFNVYKFRNLNNPKVYYDDNVARLIGNYRTSFLQLAIEKMYQGDKTGMAAVLDSMAAWIPESIFPIGHDDIYLQIGLLYHEAGRRGTNGQPGELEQRLNTLMSQKNVSTRTLLKCASIYAQTLNDYPKAIKILEQLNSQKPNDPEIAGYLVRLYEENQQYDKAVPILKNWLALHPDDQMARQMLESAQSRLTPEQRTRLESLPAPQLPR
jgi:tetratricopeptide (TPR) repeat protein